MMYYNIYQYDTFNDNLMSDLTATCTLLISKKYLRNQNYIRM